MGYNTPVLDKAVLGNKGKKTWFIFRELLIKEVDIHFARKRRRLTNMRW